MPLRLDAGERRGGSFPDSQDPHLLLDSSPSTAATATIEGPKYGDLSRLVGQAGLLDRRRQTDIARMILNAGLFGAGWMAVLLIGRSWYQLFVAVFFALVSAQIAFVGHDVGHRQTRRGRGLNDFVGVLNVNLLLGMSYGFWVDKHNRHHARPNQEGRDPDIATGAFAWTEGQARSSRGGRRFIARYQAFFFFPMLLLEALHLHIASIRALPARDATRRLTESSLLVVHVCGYLAMLFWILSPLQAIGFIVVHQGLLGLYLGSAFAPNHKGMPIFESEDDSDFLLRQITTARNVRGGRFVDLALGGLNYQIEHHLFPTMPRGNLRHSQPLVRAFCEQHGLPYVELSLFRSYGRVLRSLHGAGEPIRRGAIVSV